MLLIMTLVCCGIGKEDWKTVEFCKRTGFSKSALYELYEQKVDTDDDERMYNTHYCIFHINLCKG